MIILRLPLPPLANRYWRNYRGRMVVSAEAKAYREEVGWFFRQEGWVPLRGAVGVNIRIYRARRSGDIDGFLKILLDAMQGHAFEDDSQIVELHAFRFDNKDNPHVDVIVWQVNSD